MQLLFLNHQIQIIKMKKISILIIEDNRLLRDGLTSIIRKQTDLKVTDAIGDCAKALKCILKSEPNVVLLDLGLRNQNSLQLVRVLKKDFQIVQILYLSRNRLLNLP